MKFIMQEEAMEIPEVLSKQWVANKNLIHDLQKYFEIKKPYHLLTLGRGSSQHACLFFQYFYALKLQKLTGSFSQSLFTQYQMQPDLSQSFVLGISQSGMSPDIILPFRAFRGKAQLTFALINNAQSDLANSVDIALPLHAGQERAVAATKSFVASIFSATSIVAHLSKDHQLIQALATLPVLIPMIGNEGWKNVIEKLRKSERCFVVSRGLGLPFAQEMALKLKETCLIQAEAFSSAEVKHGPWAIVGDKFPVLLLATDQRNTLELLKLRQELLAKGALPILIAPIKQSEVDVSYEPHSISAINGILAIHSFYLFVADLAKQRGLDPDHPRNLQKITSTL